MGGNKYDQIRDGGGQIGEKLLLTRFSFRDHQIGNPEHSVVVGYHRSHYDATTGLDTHVVWRDEALRTKAFEKTIQWNTVPGLEYEIKYMREIYYDLFGKVARLLHYKNYLYSGTDIIAYDVTEEVSEVTA